MHLRSQSRCRSVLTDGVLLALGRPLPGVYPLPPADEVVELTDREGPRPGGLPDTVEVAGTPLVESAEGWRTNGPEEPPAFPGEVPDSAMSSSSFRECKAVVCIGVLDEGFCDWSLL